MKRTILSLLAFIAVAQACSAAVVTSMTNFSFNPDSERALMIVDWTGVVKPAGSFSVAAGVLEGGSFVRNGSFFNPVTPLDGIFNGSVSDAFTSLDGSDPFTGKNVVVQIIDAPTFETANFHALVDTGVPWPMEAPVVGGVVDVDISAPSATIIEGGLTIASGGWGPFAQFNGEPGLVLITPIPEPSISLLGTFAGLGMVLRRKR